MELGGFLGELFWLIYRDIARKFNGVFLGFWQGQQYLMERMDRLETAVADIKNDKVICIFKINLNISSF